MRIIFGTTNTIPYGFPDKAIERRYQRYYKPFIKCLYKYPHIKSTLHYSGYLLEWCYKRHREFIDVILELIKRKQIELLGGGMYNPIFPLLPRSDRVHQIEYNNTVIRNIFNKRVHGAWLGLSDWMPSHPSTLYSSGISYTFLDERYFRAAGAFHHTRRYYPHLTEDEGRLITVFPLLSRSIKHWEQGNIRRSIWQLYHRAIFDAGNDGVATIIGNGEHDIAIQFLQYLTRRSSRFDYILPNNYLQQFTARRRIYFQSGHVNSGYLSRIALQRSRASDLLYAKMHYSSLLVKQVHGDKERRQLGRKHIWYGQSQWPYRHTRSEEIDQAASRKSAYQSFIQAEKIARGKDTFISSLILYDFDMDGIEECLYRGRYISSYLQKRGGVLFEIDYLPSPWNWIAAAPVSSKNRLTGSKRHTKSWPPGNAFVDLLFDESATIEDWNRGNLRTIHPLHDRQYEVKQINRKSHAITLNVRCTINKKYPLSIEKEFNFGDSAITVRYRIINLSNSNKIKTVFGSALYCSPGANSDDFETYLYNNSSLPQTYTANSTCHQKVSHVDLIAKKRTSRATLACEQADELWINGEKKGGEVTLIPRWNINLHPNEEWDGTLRLALYKTKNTPKKSHNTGIYTSR